MFKNAGAKWDRAPELVKDHEFRSEAAGIAVPYGVYNVLADGSGSNGSRCRAWKSGLQQRLCNRHGLTVTVAHYAPGTSKWNPIEHRLFSELSKNWAGRPLDTHEAMLSAIWPPTPVN